MATRKISQLSLLATAAGNDELLILDVSDTTMGPAGTNKRILVSSLPSGGGGGTGTVTSVDVAGGTGLTSTGGPITTSGTITIDLDNTAVTPGTYTRANITVDQQGRLTSAASSAVLDSTNIYRTGTTGDTLNTDLTAIESDITSIKNRLVYSATETELKVNASNVLDLDATLGKATLTLGGVTAATFSGTRSDLPAVRVGAVATAYDLPTARGTANGEVMKYKSASASAVFEKVDTADLTGTTDSLTEGATKLLMTSAERTKLAGITAGAAVASVTGTAPIVSSGGTSPAISITAATTSAAGSMSAADKTKLDGIQAGAQVNAVTSVNTQTGAVVLDTDDVAEGATNLYFTNARADARTLAEKDQTLQGPRVVDLNGDGIEFQQGAVTILGVDISGVYGTGTLAYNGLSYPSADGVNGQSITTNGSGALTLAHPFSQVTTNAGTSITLALSDAGKYIRCTGATAITVQIPPGVFAVGHEILIEQTSSTAQVTITAGFAVTLRNSGNFLPKTSEQYSIVGIKCVASNEFILTGERELA